MPNTSIEQAENKLAKLAGAGNLASTTSEAFHDFIDAVAAEGVDSQALLD